MMEKWIMDDFVHYEKNIGWNDQLNKYIIIKYKNTLFF
jgi:hypothetical protein